MMTTVVMAVFIDFTSRSPVGVIRCVCVLPALALQTQSCRTLIGSWWVAAVDRSRLASWTEPDPHTLAPDSMQA